MVTLTHQRTVDASVAHMWAAFTDIQRVGDCFPGAAITEVNGPDFVGMITVTLGLVTSTYDGKGQLSRTDGRSHKATIHARGGERHGLGHADITVEVHLTRDPTSGRDPGTARCLVTMRTELDVKESPTSLGGGIAQPCASSAAADIAATADEMFEQRGCVRPSGGATVGADGNVSQDCYST